MATSSGLDNDVCLHVTASSHGLPADAGEIAGALGISVLPLGIQIVAMRVAAGLSVGPSTCARPLSTGCLGRETRGEARTSVEKHATLPIPVARAATSTVRRARSFD